MRTPHCQDIDSLLGLIDPVEEVVLGRRKKHSPDTCEFCVLGMCPDLWVHRYEFEDSPKFFAEESGSLGAI